MISVRPCKDTMNLTIHTSTDFCHRKEVKIEQILLQSTKEEKECHLIGLKRFLLSCFGKKQIGSIVGLKIISCKKF